MGKGSRTKPHNREAFARGYEAAFRQPGDTWRPTPPPWEMGFPNPIALVYEKHQKEFGKDEVFERIVRGDFPAEGDDD